MMSPKKSRERFSVAAFRQEKAAVFRGPRLVLLYVSISTYEQRSPPVLRRRQRRPGCSW